MYEMGSYLNTASVVEVPEKGLPLMRTPIVCCQHLDFNFIRQGLEEELRGEDEPDAEQLGVSHGEEGPVQRGREP